MPLHQKEQEIAMLRSELEMLMNERLNLLRIAGAAAAFVAELDAEALPETSLQAADLLSEFLNQASEETIRDALEVVKVH
ncbi:MAG: hypothetical protein K8F27_02585, partial [Sulfuricellaceae bacterium]|nr:hypothetical protein [Sulfuricellaceae bacterium]